MNHLDRSALSFNQSDSALIRPPSSWREPENHLSQLITSPWYRLLHEVRCSIDGGTRIFFEGFGADNLHVPVTTGSVSSPMGLGSDSLPVRAIIQDKEIYLADSLQFLLELGIRIARRPVYYISSSFRGEDVDPTHLAEFSHSEVEIEGDLNEIIDLGGKYVSHLAQTLLDKCEGQILNSVGSLNHLQDVAKLKGNFPRLRHSDALELLHSEPRATKELLPGVATITRAGERQIMEVIGSPVWITHMPRKSCPFYQRPEEGSDACLSADLLLGPGEILGAGERCEDFLSTSRSVADHEVDPSPYQWYLEMKRSSPLRTAGFGLGIERFIMWALDVGDIRDCCLWLRKHGEVINP
ncbi:MULTISPECIES: asparagine synthetase A [Rhizobium/Agrobacterium group]|uniref:Agrocin84-synthetase n=2 Tax=Rhizobium/Agrobacterium group TaxID=227290 RepID=B9JQQ0_RHIR8|nr:asparagine synthetase A [Agrobacterium radiobacter]AAS02120.2 probable asparaginyl-tRNA synthetase [Agrobacterium radiobacter]ACM31458.1 Agrocin84-synthetase [Rhizobium rhizogenes K84]UXT85509.1 asparagine synthetase A [Agrobacterium tumefaciens]